MPTVPIRPAQSAVNESRILDFVIPLSAGTKSGENEPMSKKILIIANWKMNPSSLAKAVLLAQKIEKSAKYAPNAEIVVAPPFPFLVPIAKVLRKAKLGAQDLFWEERGAYTGEISADMLRDDCVSYCIIGHSERRALGETDKQINKKIKTALKNRIIPVLAIGEKKRMPEIKIRRILETQLKKDLNGISKIAFKNGVIAYEPVWAIGTGLSATPEHARIALAAIQEILKRLWKTTNTSTRILYGGSVNAKNAAPFVSSNGGGMDGMLVGGASLHPIEFVKIVKSAAKLEKISDF
ncbi:MAG: triose-phosphate isomerase [bacterium]|nr:triose-phosphate isomerase [bacterium]